MQITPALFISDRELSFSFIHSAGPGGQNINKTATAVQLRFDVLNSLSLPAEIKARLIILAGTRMTQEGKLLIEAKRFRTREQNRTDALHRLAVLIEKAARPTRPRRPTRPSLAAQAKRVETKKKRGILKKERQLSRG